MRLCPAAASRDDPVAHCARGGAIATCRPCSLGARFFVCVFLEMRALGEAVAPTRDEKPALPSTDLPEKLEWRTTVWYAPDVKSMVKFATSVGSGTDWELVSYSLK